MIEQLSTPPYALPYEVKGLVDYSLLALAHNAETPLSDIRGTAHLLSNYPQLAIPYVTEPSGLIRSEQLGSIGFQLALAVTEARAELQKCPYALDIDRAGSDYRTGAEMIIDFLANHTYQAGGKEAAIERLINDLCIGKPWDRWMQQIVPNYLTGLQLYEIADLRASGRINHYS